MSLSASAKLYIAVTFEPLVLINFFCVQVALNLERAGEGGVAPCQLSRLCLALGPGSLGAMAKVLWASFTKGAPEGERPERCRLAHRLCAPGVLAM